MSTEFSMFDDEEKFFAEQVLENRPRTKETRFPSKGGIKYSSYRGSHEENIRTDNYYVQLEQALSLWTVRKLENVGCAIWLPDFKVAKVIKQKKFMQTKCHHHEKGFFALYPEEALFLLEIGDIELSCSGANLCIQDAYSLLLCAHPEDGLCTLEEYQVYSHLSRIGYRVQRFSVQRKDAKSSIAIASAKENLKRPLSPVKFDQNQEAKLCKTNESAHIYANNKTSETSRTSSVDLSSAQHKASRGWWSVVEETRKISAVHVEVQGSPGASNYIFPNLKSGAETGCLPKRSSDLIPPNTNAYECELPRIWFERITPDNNVPNDKLTAADFSYPRSIDYWAICRTAVDWTNYKELVMLAKKTVASRMDHLFKEMNSGTVKPLINPTDAHRTKHVLDKLKVIDTKNVQVDRDNFSYFIKYNVYQTDKTKPFKKTNPGKPFVRLVVCSASDPFPSLKVLKQLERDSEDAPIKLAVVETGHVMFFAFDDIQLPNDVLMG